MPQLPATGANNEVKLPPLYGTQQVQNSVPFQERLMQKFSPQDYVIIKNIDDQPVVWQYLPSHKEEVGHTPDGMQRIVTRKQPEQWYIEPGQTEVLVGASAYLALDAMYKQHTASTVLKREGITASYDKENQHLPKNFNYADGGAQEKFINEAYLGKANPTFGGNAAAEVTAEANATAPKEKAPASR